MDLLNNVVGSTNRLTNYLQANSPRILTIAGMSLTTAACVTTGIATWKMHDVMAQHNTDIADLHEDLKAANTPEEEEEIKMLIMKRYAMTIGMTAALYSMPTICLGGSFACQITSAKEYENRLAVATATGLLFKTAYDNAKARVEEKYGEEEAAELFYGAEKSEVTTIDEKNKAHKKTITKYDPYGITSGNPCSILIGEGIDSRLSDIYNNKHEMIKTINDIITWYQYMVDAGHPVKVYELYTDVHDGLGIKMKGQSKALEGIYMSNGWYKDPVEAQKIRDRWIAEGIIFTEHDVDRELGCFIDLGINSVVNEQYVDGLEPMLWIIPNCNQDIDALLYPSIDKQKDKYIA